MGGSASRRIEEKLRSSQVFPAAVLTSYKECLAMAHHTSTGIFAYQLLDAARRIYDLIPAAQPQHAEPDPDTDTDPAIVLKDKWLSLPPSQFDVDRTIRQEGLFHGGKKVLGFEEFCFFASCVFRDMTLAAAEHKLAFYVPVGTLGVLFAHLTLRRLPLVGPAYTSMGVLMPGLLLGSVLGAVASLGFELP